MVQTSEAPAPQTTDRHNGEQHPLRTDGGVTGSRGKEVASGSNLTVANSTLNDTAVSRQVREVGTCRIWKASVTGRSHD